MWKNYLNTMLRSMWRHKAFSLINIMGLAIGLACCLLILIYVQYEFSFDRYHRNTDRLYRVTLHAILAGNEIEATTSPYPLAATLSREYPEIEAAGRLRQFFRDTLVGTDNGAIRYQEKRIFHADPALFDIFDFDFLAGDPRTALNEPGRVVLTRSMAQKYFASLDVVGQTLTFSGERDYLVTGVIDDVPDNSHVHPDFLVSFTSDEDHDSQIWISNNIQTYALLRPGTSVPELTVKLREIVRKYVGPQIEEAMGFDVDQFFNQGGAYDYRLQPIADIHLHSAMQGEVEPNGNINYVLTFIAVALFILLLACVNFMNLSTASSANRAREIGVRKTLGAGQGQLIVQFLAESVMLTLIALAVALPLVALLLPAFGAVTERQLTLQVLLSFPTLPLLCVFPFLIGLIAGSYPALYLARFHPLEVLKGSLSGGLKSGRFRSLLVVFQFAISVALVSATLIVFTQLDYMRNKSLGFEKDQVVIIHRANALGDARDAFLTQLENQSGVLSVSSSVHVPGVQFDQNVYYLDGQPSSESKPFWSMTVGYNFLETLGFELIAGRTFSRDFGDDENAYVINERAAGDLGITDPLQHRIVEPGPSGVDSGPIIGVMRDFHFESLHQEIRPLVIRLDDFTRFIAVKIRPEAISQSLTGIEATWRQVTANEPFEYTFLDADFESLYAGDRRLGLLFSGFSVLAIFIACLGLYGLASYTILLRTKEIGIRKTLGASLQDIVLLMSKDFMRLVLIAILVAVPVAYFGMNSWLQLFYYRINMPLPAFLIAGLLAVVIAFITVSVQSLASGLQNPVYSLRDE